MAHDADKKREARRRYVFDRQPLTTVAAALKISEGAARRWKRDAREKGDDWDRARAANSLAGEGFERLIADVVQDYVAVHQKTIEDLRDDREMAAADKARILAALADSFNKTVNAAGRVSPKISELGVAMDVLKRFSEFIAQNHPALAPGLLEILEPFGQILAESYG